MALAGIVAGLMFACANPAAAAVSVIAFESTTASGETSVWATSAAGDQAQVVVEGASRPSFAPDADRIAYLTESPLAIRVGNTDGSGTHTVREFSSPETFDFGPGGRIAFTEREPTAENGLYDVIRLIDSDGNGLVTVYRPPTTSLYEVSSPALSPGGGQVVFSQVEHRGDFDPQIGIFVVNSDGSGLTQLTTIGSDEDPEFSPGGSEIVFSRNDDIFVMNANGSGAANLTNTPTVDELGPTYSPDGTQIAFEADGKIEVMNADGSGRHLLTGSLAGTEANPTWAELPALPSGPQALDRSLKIAYSAKRDHFAGRIRSSEMTCKRGRVKVFRVKKGRDRKVTSDSANKRGRWVADEDAVDGRYYAKVAQRTTDAGTCPAVRSPTIRVG